MDAESRQRVQPKETASPVTMDFPLAPQGQGLIAGRPRKLHRRRHIKAGA